MDSAIACPHCLALVRSTDEPCPSCGRSFAVADAVRFAGFWVRFAAFWLDIAIWLPYLIVYDILDRRYRHFLAYDAIPQILIGIIFWVYLVRRFGGTPGKLIMGIRIVRLDGSPVGYREALLRYAPECILAVLLVLAGVLARERMTDAQYIGLDLHHQLQMEHELSPIWRQPVDILNTAWGWSEFVVLLMNRRRRALHDFLAGTMVIRRRGGPETVQHQGETAVAIGSTLP